MDIVKAAMRRPISVAVILLGIALAGFAAISRIPRDIFPNLDVPAIFVAQPYAGMDAAQMEGYLTSRYEIGFLYVSGIEHIESKSIQGMSIIKLQFHPGTDMANAMAETINQIQRAQRFMPRGSVPPFVIRFDAGSLPVGSLVISSPTRTEAEMQDLAASRIRPLLASIPGLSAPPPFGGSDRAIVIHVDPDRLRSHNLSSEEIVEALASSNIMSPSGNARIGNLMPAVSLNSVVRDVKELGNVAIRPGQSPAVFLRDVATVEDSASVETGYALIDGRRTVYIPVAKRAEASTFAVANRLNQNLPRRRLMLPSDVNVSYQFDQSYYVTRSIQNLTMEGLLGAVLTGLMALLFLRDWRSALVVVLSIPISLLAALIGLWGSNQTINLMTLGGLALSVGILVDMATVVIENIHTHRAKGRSIARAALDATNKTRIPSMLAMLCILAVFIPSFFMTGAIRAMFVPLSLAVGFAMIAAFFLSVTFVPILTTRLLRARPPHGSSEHPSRFSFGALQSRYGVFLRFLLRFRLFVVPAYVAAAGIVIVGLGGLLGTEIFPASDRKSTRLNSSHVSESR